MSLLDRVEDVARELARREAAHRGELDAAAGKARALHAEVDAAIRRFNELVADEAPHLRVEVSPPRVDDKHLHAAQFDLERGRHRAIVTVKSRGEVTLVGPFRAGKNEGPCRSFDFDADAELDDALADFVTRFLEEAAAP